ncbi:MAG: uroporphyrinogen decarboxylase family protein [Planctomycetota bacterium]
MNSKQRVQAALERREHDRTPLGFYTVDCDTIAAVIGRPTLLRNRAGQKLAWWEGRRDEAVARMKADVVDFYRKLDCVDLLTLKEACQVPPRGFRDPAPPRRTGPNTYEEKDGSTWKLDPTTNSVEYFPAPGALRELPEYTAAQFADRKPPERPDASCFELSDHLIKHFGADRYIAGYSGGVQAMVLLGGMEQGLMTMALQPEVVKAAAAQAVHRMNATDAWAIRPGTDGVLIEEDMAGTNGPMVSPAMFRELCHPYYRERVQALKKKTPHVIMHNCGNNLPIMDMLVAGGIDAYESIQTNSAMSIKTLLDGYGDRICAWGAVALEVLNTGTPADARKAVRTSYAEAAGRPGFILGPSHSIAFGTKYDNFMAMLDEHVKLRDRR